VAVDAGGGGFSRLHVLAWIFWFPERAHDDLTGQQPECEEQDYVMLI
jgi:hypothetical protein